MKNYLALDIGAARIGVAVGSVVPAGRGTLDGHDEAAVLATLEKLIKDENITTLVVGVPRVKSGDITASQRLALDWVKKLQDEFHLPVEMVDESYSSIEAESQLRKEGVDTHADKGKIDERAAELILAQFLSEQA